MPEEEEEVRVAFSHTGGFYVGEQLIELYCPGGEIYYTTDGNFPNPRHSAHRYNRPIRISSTTVVQAIAVKDGKQSARVAQTYFIDEPRSTFATVSVAIPPAVLFNPETGLFVKGPNAVDSVWQLPGANFWSRSEVDAHTEIFETDGHCVFRSGTGFRLFGGMSRLFPQKSLAIVTRSRYGQRRIKHRLFGDEGLKKFKFIVLRNSGSDFGKSHFRDVFMTSLVDGWDLDIQDYRPAHVYLNGKYWGVYHIREKINRYFVAGHYNVDKDSIDLMEHRYTRKRGRKGHYLRMLSFLENNSLADPSNMAYIQGQMEIENFLDYQIAQIYFDNQDAGGNIRYWRPQKPGGKWRWILYDTDWGFGLHNPEAYKSNSLDFHTAPNGPAWPNPPWSTFILRKLLENKSLEKTFVNRFCDHLNTSLEPKQVDERIDYFVEMLQPEIFRHLDRWKLPEETWHEQIKIIRRFGKERANFVRMHLQEKFDLGRQREVEIDINAGGEVSLNDHLSLKNTHFQGVYFENIPIRLKAKSHLGYRFSHWEMDGERLDVPELIIRLARKHTSIKAVFEPFSFALANEVIINEINVYNKECGDWLELYNNTNEKVRLHNWQLIDSKHTFRLPNVVLPPKDYLILCEDANRFKAYFPQAYRYIGDLEFGFDKREERLGLYTAEGAFVDSVTYRVSPSDSAFTLNLMLPGLDNADPENWEIRFGPGTPNAANHYYVESSLRARRELWMEIGAAAGVILVCMMLLFLRHQRLI